MSGGTWQYGRLRLDMEEIGEDPIVKEQWPLVAKMFMALATALYEVEHDIDWYLSGDSSITEKFEIEAVEKILIAAMRVAPDELFLRQLINKMRYIDE